ncbi:MAG: hypothetical protein ACK2U1_05815 [Anaerolineales bacterium]
MKSRIVTSAFILICLTIILFVGSLIKGYDDQQMSVVAAPQDSVIDILPDLEKTDQIDSSQPIQSPYPKIPPDARKIDISDPDIAGYAQVTGSIGAVPAEASVVIVNLSAHNLITTTANTQGGFTASLFAPFGSSLLVKYEITGDRIKDFWQKAVQSVADSTTENLNELPGTVLYVGGPEERGEFSQAFHTVGAVSSIAHPKEWAGWWMQGVLEVPNPSENWRMSVMQDDVLNLNLQMFATSPDLDCGGGFTGSMSISPGLREMFGADGVAKAWEVWFDASLFTPTGLPIEHEGFVPSVNLGTGPVEFGNFDCLQSDLHDDVLTGNLSVELTIPSDLPDGYYRPDFFFIPDVTLSDQVPQAVVWLDSGERPQGLPILRVGEPAPPRIPWMLFDDDLVNGQRGVTAYQDSGRFEMVNRVITTPHLSVIPRIDDRTGEAIVYDLTPGASWLSNTDRRLAPPPHIPLQYPSGEMSVEIHQPDGTMVILDPAPLQGSSVRTPTTPGGAEFAIGTGHLGDIYHLYNFDDAFKYEFQQEGIHLIQLHGTVFDVFGNPYSLESTYELMVAHVLDIDPNILPTMPFTQDDFFSAGLHLFPPVPAHVKIKLTHIPDSDLTQTEIYTITGQANMAGYFHTPPGFNLPMDSAGEYRVDISAEHHTPSGEVWFGSMTWGSVVESSDLGIKAHGRRGMDYHGDLNVNQLAWFRNQDLITPTIGIENYYPYHSGDIHWGNQVGNPNYGGDSIHTILTFEDPPGGEDYYELIRAHYPKATNVFRWPPDDENNSIDLLNDRIAIGEAPLFITTQSGKNPELYPEEIDLLGYWYGSSQRPDVRVRELISEDNMGTAYWRFDDTYGYQIGEPADGDHPGDIKWEFGGLVLRTITETNPINQYAIYSSLWVLMPDACDEYGCARVTAPFRVNAGTIDGGPIMTLLGDEINNFFLPKCVRPGDILDLDNTIAFCGHVGPPLNSRVDVTITSPSGVTYTNGDDWLANKIGWLYDPGFDFPAEEPGRWTVDVFVEYDSEYLSYGLPVNGHNTGTVLGTQGQYEFYIVEPDAPALYISNPQPGFIVWPDDQVELIPIEGIAPWGTQKIYYTIHDKGIVMEQGSLTPGYDGSFTLIYDAKKLHEDFPMLSLTAHEGRWEGLADEVAIHLLAVGSEAPHAAAVTLIGEQVFLQSGEQQNPWDVIFLPLAEK